MASHPHTNLSNSANLLRFTSLLMKKSKTIQFLDTLLCRLEQEIVCHPEVLIITSTISNKTWWEYKSRHISLLMSSWDDFSNSSYQICDSTITRKYTRNGQLGPYMYQNIDSYLACSWAHLIINNIKMKLKQYIYLQKCLWVL